MRCAAAVSRTASRDLAGCFGSSSAGGARERRGGRIAMQTKRSFLSLSLSALLASAGRASAQQTPPPILIKAGISDPVNTVLAWYMAHAAGLYTAQRLKADIMNMSGGSK